MGESDTRIMERFGPLLLKLSLSLFFLIIFYAGPRSRATAARLGLRHSSEAARWIIPDGRRHRSSLHRDWPRPIFTVSLSSKLHQTEQGKRHISLGEERLALPPVLEPKLRDCGSHAWAVDRSTWCLVRPVSAFGCALLVDHSFLYFAVELQAVGSDRRARNPGWAQNFFFSADQNRSVVHLCISSTA